MNKILRGSGGKPKSPTVVSDNLFSRDLIEFTLGVVEGPIGGLVRGAKSFYAGDTPLMSEAGEPNFTPFHLHVYHGSDLPSPIQNVLGGNGSSLQVGVPLAHETAVTRVTPSNLRGEIDQLEIRLAIQSLVNATDNGDQLENTLELTIEFKATDETQWRPFVDNEANDPKFTIKGKTSSGYVKELVRQVQRRSNADWEIRITKHNIDNDRNWIAEASWESIQCIKKDPVSYPNLAVVRGLGQASDQFSSIPTFAGVYALSLIKIPSNYDPVTRFYNGAWDGTFKLGHTDNPAWVMYDLIMSTRYGFKAYLPKLQADRFSFYDAAKWFDELVPRKGGTGYEPRATFNYVIDQQKNARDLLAHVASTFNSIIMVNQANIATVKVDKPGAPLQLFGPESIVKDSIQYQFTDPSARPNDITVQFMNPNLGFAQDFRRVFNQELIDRYGRVTDELEALNCLSVYEAERRASLRLFTAHTETASISFQTTRAAMRLEVFDLIAVVDPDMGHGLSGRVKAVNGRTITLRDALYVPAGQELVMGIQTRSGLVEIPVTSATAQTTQLTIKAGSSWPASAPAQAQFSLSHAQLGMPKLYRILSFAESSENPDVFNISAHEHNPAKYGDSLEVINSTETTVGFVQKTIPSKPTFESVDSGEAHVLIGTNNRIRPRVFIRFTDVPSDLIDHHILSYRVKNTGQFETVAVYGGSHYLEGFDPGIDLEMFAVAVNAQGRRSQNSGLVEHKVSNAALAAPAAPTNLAFTVDTNDLILTITPPAKTKGITGYEIRLGGTNWDTARLLGHTNGTTFRHVNPGATSLTYRVKSRTDFMVSTGSYSKTYNVTGSLPAPTGWQAKGGYGEVRLEGQAIADRRFAKFNFYGVTATNRTPVLLGVSSATAWAREAAVNDAYTEYAVCWVSHMGQESAISPWMPAKPMAVSIEEIVADLNGAVADLDVKATIAQAAADAAQIAAEAVAVTEQAISDMTANSEQMLAAAEAQVAEATRLVNDTTTLAEAVEVSKNQIDQTHTRVTGIQTSLNKALEDAEKAKDDAITAATSSAAAKVDAQAAQDRAETALANAQAALIGANSAKTAAETAVTNAVSAKTAAETARGAAETARTQAQTAAGNAGDSATAAAGSASTAASNSTTAGNSASAAAAAAVIASNKADGALAAAEAAVTSASSAAMHSSAAETSATAAAADRIAASAARSGAESARDTAITAKETAQSSEAVAVEKASLAANSATAAGSSALAAAGSATTAQSKATEASQAATTATTQAQTATTKAGEASNSATSAATSASNSSGSANSASISASNAATAVLNTQRTLYSTAATINSVADPITLPFSSAYAGVAPAAIAATNYNSDEDGAFLIRTMPTTYVNAMARGSMPASASGVYRVTARVKMTVENSVQVVIGMLDDKMNNLTHYGIGTRELPAGEITTLTWTIGRLTSQPLVDTSAGSAAFWNAAKFLRFGIRSRYVSEGRMQVYSIVVEDLTQVSAATVQANAANTSASQAAASATLSGQEAFAATTAKSAADTARSGAESARDAAVTARDTARSSEAVAVEKAALATTSANQAGESATAAATSASTAGTKATEASQAASLASTHAQTATTRAGEASNSATQAAQSKTDAAGSASSAANSATTAANASDGVLNRLLGTAMIPNQFLDRDLWTTSTIGLATNVASAPSSRFTLEHTTPVYRVAPASAGNLVAPKSLVPGGRGGNDVAYRVSFRYKVEGGNAATTNLGLSFMDDTGVQQHAATTPIGGSSPAVTGASEILTHSRVIATFAHPDVDALSVNAKSAHWLRFYPRIGTGNAAGLTLYSMEIEDVTHILKASAAASAASTSASQAAASVTEARQQASAANTAKLAAETAQTGAETARTEAVSARETAKGSASTATTQAGLAATARTNADNAATAAANSATTANTRATEASQSATLAATHAQTASTKAGEASNSATQAAQSKTDAAGSASSASSSASTAASARNTALHTAISMMPSTMEGEAQYFSTSLTGSPEARLSQTMGSFVTFPLTDRGAAVSMPGGLARTVHFATKKYLTMEPGRKYRLTVTARHQGPFVDDSSRCMAIVLRRVSAADWTSYSDINLSGRTGAQEFTAPDTWQDFVVEWTAPDTGSMNILAFPYARSPQMAKMAATSALQVVKVLIEDITSESNAAISASAANTSAAQAAASHTAAGQQASAAQQAKTAAETAQTGAETARTEAVSAKETAQGSASTATTQAGLATTARTNADNAATAAANSATTANTKATEASQSANLASTHAQTASTKAGEASNSATQAAQSKTDAAGSASSANNSATTAARAAMSAAQAGARLPSTFEEGFTYFTSAHIAGAPETLTATSRLSLVSNDVDFGAAIDCAATEAAHAVATRGYLPVKADTIFLLRVRLKVMSGSVSPTLYLRGVDAEYKNISPTTIHSFGSKAPADGVLTASFTVSATAGPGVDKVLSLMNQISLARIYVQSSDTRVGVYRVGELLIEDVTERVRAENAALAASTSATSAAASSNAAGQQAEAANSARTAAETAKSGAESARSEAVTAKETAQGSATTATTQAGLATTARTNADNAATAAANSASTASSKATEASQSASLASTHAQTASTKAGEASNSATQAAQSKRDAEGSASSASSSASTAATALNDLVNTLDAAPVLPAHPGLAPRQWTSRRTGLPRAVPTLSVTVVDDTILGPSGVLRSTTAGSNFLTKGVLPFGGGRIYRARVQMRVVESTLATEVGVHLLVVGMLQNGEVAGSIDYTNIGLFKAPVSGAPVNIDVLFSDTADAANNVLKPNTTNAAEMFRFGLRVDSSGTHVLHVSMIEVRDVTNEVKSRIAASAAATSATQAAASNTAAGQQASAAQQAKIAAETAKTGAESARTEAVSAKEDAKGSATTATSGATLAARSQREAVQLASGNLYRRSVFEDGEKDGWGGAVVNVPEPHPAGRTKALRCTARDTYYGTPEPVALTGMHKFRITGYVYNRSNTHVRVGFNTNPPTGNQTWPVVLADTALSGSAVWKRFDVELNINMSNVASWRPFLQIEGTAGNHTFDTYWTDLVATDITSEKAAESSATAAQQSATTASTKATEAGTSAETATSAAGTAVTKAGEASTWASTAATAAEEASGSAQAASTSAGVAASSKSAAQLALSAASNIFPIRPLASLASFGTAAAGLPENYVATAETSVAFQTDSTHGPFFRRNAGSGSNGVYHRGLASVRDGMAVYKIRAKIRCNTTGVNQRIRVQFIRPDGTSAAAISLVSTPFAAGEIKELSCVIGRTAGGLVTHVISNATNWAQAMGFRIGVDNVTAGTNYDLFELEVVDLTEADQAARSATAAGGSAEAAALSATTASTKAGEASASAVQALSAETATKVGAIQMMPATMVNNAFAFTHLLNGTQAQRYTTAGGWIAGAHWFVDTNQGPAVRFGKSSSNQHLSARQILHPLPNHRYRMEVLARHVGAFGTNTNQALHTIIRAVTETGATGPDRNNAAVVFSATDTWQTFTVEFDTESSTALVCGIYLSGTRATNLAATSFIEVASIRVLDITSEQAAKSAATAAQGAVTLADEHRAAAQAFSETAARMTTGGQSVNPTFNIWPGNNPSHITTAVQTGNTLTKVTGDGAKYVNAALMVGNAASTEGPNLTLRTDTASHRLTCSKSPEAVLVRAEIEIVEVANWATWNATIAAAWVDNGSNRWSTKPLRELLKNEPGIVQVVEVYLTRPTNWVGTGTQNFLVRAMARASTGSTATIKLHRLDFEEVLASSATAITQKAVADLAGLQQSMIGLRSKAGSAVAELELATMASPNGTASAIRMNADNIIMNGTIEAKKLKVDFLTVNNRLVAKYLDIDSMLTIKNGGSLRYGKASVADKATDGLFFGAAAGGAFAFAASRTQSGRRQSISLSKATGLELLNARHFVSGASVPVNTNYTANATSVAIPVGTTHLRLLQVGGGQAGQAINADGTTTINGANGGNTVVQIYDGNTLKQTITAAGGTGHNSVRDGEDSPYGAGGVPGAYSSYYQHDRDGGYWYQNYTAGQPPAAAAYGAGGGGAYLGAAKGGASGAYLDTTVDVSNFANPRISITIGAGGAGANGGGALQHRSGAGQKGYVQVSTSTARETPADILPLMPTNSGTITKTGLEIVFPNLGAGLWVLSDMNYQNFDIGQIDIGDGQFINLLSGGNVTFVSSKTPVRLSGGYSANRTIRFNHYSMGNWG